MIVRGDGSCNTASVLSRHGFIPSGLIMYPRNIHSAAPNCTESRAFYLSIIESLPTSPIPVEDSDPVQEEIDIFTGSDGLMPSGIKNEDYDSKGDICFLEELPNNNLISLPEHESPNLDHQDNPSTPRPPPEPPDVKIRLEPDTTVINNFDVLNKDACFNLEEGVQIFLPFFTYPVNPPFLYSFGSEDTIFDPDIST
ncbi:hypothetical protein Tco_0707297 [Tanacetum coccineum]|uniref:Uncharacterized protein n=1 Tax=Tanacetum coccineum TaxID=301880 RepID=A0ABQ4Y9X7_9ASTR